MLSFFTTIKDKITLESRLKNVEADIKRIKVHQDRIESEMMDLIASQEIIRNKMLRKFQIKKEEKSDEPKDLYSSMLLPEPP